MILYASIPVTEKHRLNYELSNCPSKISFKREGRKHYATYDAHKKLGPLLRSRLLTDQNFLYTLGQKDKIFVTKESLRNLRMGHHPKRKGVVLTNFHFFQNVQLGQRKGGPNGHI